MLSLIKYTKKYKFETVIGPLFKFFEACMEIFVPLIMSQIIDVGIVNNDKGYILKMGGLMMLIAVLGWGFAITAQFFCAKAALGFGTELRKALFFNILNFETETVDKYGIPSLITRLTNDVNRAQTGFNFLLRLALRAPFVVSGAIIMSGIINVTVMLIYIAIVLIIVLCAFIVTKYNMPVYEKIQGITDKIAVFCRENIIGIRSVRAFGMQKKESEEFSEKADELCKEQIRAGRISALLNPINNVIINIAIIIVLWIGSVFVFDGVLLSGKIIALVNYLTQILVAVVAAIDLTVTLNRGAASAKRVAMVLNEASGVQKVLDEIKAEENDSFICFDNVDFGYKNSRSLSLKNVSFSVKKGDSVGIIGGTGSGKSTLVKLLQGIYPVSRGAVFVAGKNINSYEEKEKRRLFSFVPQRALLFKGSVRENMKWGKAEATDEEIITALKNAEAWSFISEKEGQLDFEIEQSGRNLSGGQKQRLTIARALLKESPVIIFDDSTSALDYVTESRIRKYVAGDKLSEVTKFIVSQRTSAISHCDLIIVLDEGSVCGLGTHSELLESCTVYREIYLSQHGNAEEVAKL